MKLKLPPRTVERLSKYRRLLEGYNNIDEAHIFSHNLAGMLNLTPEQVRRDLMLIGLSGNHRKGYSVGELVQMIGQTIDRKEGHRVALVGLGNLGRAVLGFIRKAGAKMDVVAVFDIDRHKVNTHFTGVPCFDLNDAGLIIKREQIGIAILTVPPEAAAHTTAILLQAGIRGILNFTSVHLDVPPDIYLKDYDIITSLEEIGFFIKQ
jgi:redox-sensing transcriptional repressor